MRKKERTAVGARLRDTTMAGARVRKKSGRRWGRAIEARARGREIKRPRRGRGGAQDSDRSGGAEAHKGERGEKMRATSALLT